VPHEENGRTGVNRRRAEAKADDMEAEARRAKTAEPSFRALTLLNELAAEPLRSELRAKGSKAQRGFRALYLEIFSEERERATARAFITRWLEQQRLDFRMLGFFWFPPEVPDDRIPYLIRVNGCTILYGILRGVVASLTGMFPEGPLALPTIMMQEVVRDIEANRDDASPAAPNAARKPKTSATPPKKAVAQKAAKRATKKTAKRRER
jgi:hypothetical protein